MVITVESQAPAPAPAPSVTFAVAGPTTVGRGDNATFTATITNTGTTNLTGGTLTISISPDRRIRSLRPGATVTLASLPPGASAVASWTGRADRVGSATATVDAAVDGSVIATAVHFFEVQK